MIESIDTAVSAACIAIAMCAVWMLFYVNKK